MVNHGPSLQSLQPLGKRSERTAAQTPTQAKFLLGEGFTNQLWNNRKAWLTGPWFLNNRNLSKTNWLSFKQTPCLSLLFFLLFFADFPISKQLDPFSSKQTWITKECCSAILNRFAHFSLSSLVFPSITYNPLHLQKLHRLLTAKNPPRDPASTTREPVFKEKGK